MGCLFLAEIIPIEPDRVMPVREMKPRALIQDLFTLSFLNRMRIMKGFLTIILLVFYAHLVSGQFSISGTITNEDGERLENATIYIEGTNLGALAGPRGIYNLKDIPEGDYVLKFSFLGFETVTRKISLDNDLNLDIVMPGSIFGLDEIEINGTWVQKNMPFSHKNLPKREFEKLNLGQDVPYLLKFTPSMVVTSDAGAGVGYTGMRIRGSDPSRINVTINGVPLNDSESQLVFWVDLPDFGSSAQEIQIQRGVGPSTNGTSAFGATINMNTNKIKLQPYLSFASSYGSFNTRKINVSGGTGLMNNKLAVDVRYSNIYSDGYIDRATSNLQSFYSSINYISERSSLNFNFISGTERTYQAWNGLPFQYLENDRRFNISGTEKPGAPYQNEVDDYGQHHAQLHYNLAVNNGLNINLTGHYTRGLGFFENYKSGEDLNSFNINDNSGESHDIVIRRWLDNHFYGGIFEMDWKDLEEKNNFIFGASINQYLGDHFGHLIWNSRDNDPFEDNIAAGIPVTEYYFNDAVKTDFNTYGKWTYRIKDRFITYLDLQYRKVHYKFQGYDEEGFLISQTDNLDFFNPKLGMSYLLNTDSKIYVSYGIANREPNRNDYTESSVISRPLPERLNDLEIGYNIQVDNFVAGVNIYNMVYDNQLVLTGAINDVGQYTRSNVKDSYRRGMEIDGGLNDWRGFHLLVNATISQNRIKSFTEFIDDWDNGVQIEKTYELTDLAFSPAVILANDFGYEFLKGLRNQSASVNLLTKYVGKQYIDNTSNNYAALDPYTYSDLLLNYRISNGKWFREISFNINIHNVLNSQYVSNAWIYRFQSSGYNPVDDDPYSRSEGQNVYNLTGLFPQAGRYFLAGISVLF